MFSPVKNNTTEPTTNALVKLFQKVGKPKLIVSDRARSFTSSKFKTYLQEQGTELHLIATGIPRRNGQVEHVMRTLFNLMRSMLTYEKESKWTTVLPQIEAVLNETVSSASGFTPNALMFGRKQRWPKEETLLEGIPTVKPADCEAMKQQANRKLEQGRTKQQKKFNEKRLPAVQLKVGDQVVVQDTQKAGSGKLGVKYLGPYEVRYVLKGSDD